MKQIKAQGVEVVVYEPNLKEEPFFGSWVITSLEEFNPMVNVIITNRQNDGLADVMDKVYNRDIYEKD